MNSPSNSNLNAKKLSVKKLPVPKSRETLTQPDDSLSNKLMKFCFKTEYKKTDVFSEHTIASDVPIEPKTQKSLNGIIKQ